MCGGGGGGGGEAVSPYTLKITVAYAFISSSRFHPSLTGVAVHAKEVCLQVDLSSVQ